MLAERRLIESSVPIWQLVLSEPHRVPSRVAIATAPELVGFRKNSRRKPPPGDRTLYPFRPHAHVRHENAAATSERGQLRFAYRRLGPHSYGRGQYTVRGGL